MKKYKIYFDEEILLACDEDGYFEVIDTYEEKYEENYNYKTSFDEAELFDYLTDQNPKAKINYEFVQKFIEVFGVEVEE